METYQVLFVILFSTFGFILLGGGFWYLLQRKNMLAKARLERIEAVNRLVEKFGTAKEVTEFLKTEGGRRLLEDPVPPAELSRLRVIRLVQVGVVILCVGIAFILNAYSLRDESYITFISQAKDRQFYGMVSIALGGGLLLVALVTNVLVKKWGLNGSRGKDKPRLTET